MKLNSEVICIPTLTAVNPELGGSAPGIGLAIPSDTATDVAGQIVANGRVVNSKRAALGVSISTVVDQSGQLVAVGIFDVVPGGPAANAGLQNGDVITKVDDVPVTTGQQLAGSARHASQVTPCISPSSDHPGKPGPSR